VVSNNFTCFVVLRVTASGEAMRLEESPLQFSRVDFERHRTESWLREECRAARPGVATAFHQVKQNLCVALASKVRNQAHVFRHGACEWPPVAIVQLGPARLRRGDAVLPV
jgi:hypothetical protein